MKRETVQPDADKLQDVLYSWLLYAGVAACMTGLGVIAVLLVQDLAKAVAP